MNENHILRPHSTKPRLFYGYILVIFAFFIMVVSWAVYNSFGVFFKPLQNEFSWTSATTSGAFSLSMIIYGVLGIAVGGLNDRFGPRIVVTFCGFLLGIGYLLMSQVNTLWQLYLFLGVIVGVGMSGVWVPQLSTVARWFVKRRTLMTGIVIAGAGIGQLIGPPVITRLISIYDWRISFIIMGGVALVAMVLAAQFLKRDPVQMGQLPYGEDTVIHGGPESETGAYSLREAIHTAQFWLSFTMLFCSGYGFFSIIVHIVPHVIELEISAVDAANILAVMGGVSILGNYLLGGIADKIGNRQVFVICFIMMSASLFLLLPAREMWLLYLFSIIFGAVMGGLGAAESPLTARLFGLSSHGLIYGVVHLGFTVGASVGPFVTGYIFDLTGSYQTAFIVCAAVGIAGIIVTMILRPTKRLGGRI